MKGWLTKLFHKISGHEEITGGQDKVWRNELGQPTKEGSGFLCHPSMPYYYGGVHDSSNSFYTKEKLRQHLDHAIAIISQSETGRHLLQEIHKTGYVIRYDDVSLKELKASASCENVKKIISISTNTNVTSLANNIVHEATHGVQLESKELQCHYAQHPSEYLMILYATEADAVAHEIVVALELAAGENKNQYKSNIMLQNQMLHNPGTVCNSISAMARHTQSSRATNIKLNATLDQETKHVAMRAAFNSFYVSGYLRNYYETDGIPNYFIQMSANILPISMTLTKKGKLTSEFNQVATGIKTNINHFGHSYIDTQAINLNHPYYCGISTEGLYIFEKLLEKPVKPEWGIKKFDIRTRPPGRKRVL